ncbi:Holliday junction resolvase RuvX [soil metagenome]
MSRPGGEEHTPAARILAFDYGLRRTGVAVGDTATGAGSPLVTLQARPDGPDWNAIEDLLREWRPDLVLVGIPRMPDGGEGSFSPAARKFATELRARFGVRVETADETLTSREARELLRDDRRSGRRMRRVRREDADALAALLILRGWLQDHSGS